MDPNANLQEMLENITEAISLRDMEDPALLDTEEVQEVITDYLRLAELVEALNEWIRKGGALPEVWQVEQDKLSSEYLKATLAERFPWVQQIQRTGIPTADYEEPDGADVIDAVTELWSEVIADPFVKPELVPLFLGERQMLTRMMEKFREHIGDPAWDIGYGEDDVYSGSFDIMRKLDSQPEPPPTGPVNGEAVPATFMTEDGYKLQWDPVNRHWTNGDFIAMPAGWSWWPVDDSGVPLSGSLI